MSVSAKTCVFVSPPTKNPEPSLVHQHLPEGSPSAVLALQLLNNPTFLLPPAECVGCDQWIWGRTQAPGTFFFQGEQELQPPYSSWPVFSPTLGIWLELQDLCSQLQKHLRLCPPVRVFDLWLWFASKDRDLLGSRGADSLFAYSWVPHLCMLISLRIKMATVYWAGITMCQALCRAHHMKCPPPFSCILVLFTLLYFFFFP